MELNLPKKESGPYSLKISIIKPFAADDDKVFTKTRGTSSDGNLISLVIGLTIDANISRAIEVLNTPTAIIKPIIVGNISKTVLNPSFAPLVNSWNTDTLHRMPYPII